MKSRSSLSIRARAQQFFERVQKGGLLQNVAWLLTGNGLAQMISLALNPILSRHYSADEFGHYAVYSGMVATFGILVTLRFEYAILKPKSSQSSVRLCWISILMTMITTGLMGIFLFAAPQAVEGSPKLEVIFELRWLIYFNLILIGLFTSLSYLATRFNQFSSVAAGNLLNNGSAAGSQLALSYSQFSSVGLEWGSLLGRFVALMPLLRWVYKKKELHFLRWHEFKEIKKEFLESYKYCLSSLAPGVIEILTLQLPVFFLYMHYESSTSGFYLQAQKLISAPISLISNAFFQALLPRLSLDRFELKDVQQVIRRSTQKLTIIFCLTLPVLIAGSQLMGWYFGPKWEGIEFYGFILALSLSFRIISVPISSFLYSNDNFRLLLWQVLYLSVTVTTIFILINLNWNPKEALILLSAVDGIMMIMLAIYVLNRVGLDLKTLLKYRD